jgi:hypothetical protein
MFTGADMPSSAFPVDGRSGFDAFAMTFGADEVAFGCGLWIVRLAAGVDVLVFAEAAGDAADAGVIGVVGVSAVPVGVRLPVDFLRARLEWAALAVLSVSSIPATEAARAAERAIAKARRRLRRMRELLGRGYVPIWQGIVP